MPFSSTRCPDVRCKLLCLHCPALSRPAILGTAGSLRNQLCTAHVSPVQSVPQCSGWPAVTFCPAPSAGVQVLRTWLPAWRPAAPDRCRCPLSSGTCRSSPTLGPQRLHAHKVFKSPGMHANPDVLSPEGWAVALHGPHHSARVHSIVHFEAHASKMSF
jgi:hypothetical protein